MIQWPVGHPRLVFHLEHHGGSVLTFSTWIGITIQPVMTW
jgi:hypothetical protein